MDRNQRTLHIQRISMGAARCRLDGELFYLGLPTRFHIYEGNELYQEVFESACDSGIFTDDQIIGILAKEGMWDCENDDTITRMQKDMEDLKVSVYESRFRLNDFQTAKLRIKKKRQELITLLGQKHIFDYASAEGLGSLHRLNYLILAGLRDKQFNPITKTLDDIDGAQLNIFKEAFLGARLDESVLRELARTEPWRSYWAVADKNNVFGRPLMEWTEEQQTLVIWSKLYDSLRENTEPPTDEVVNDDDSLDGWLILQSRKNKHEASKQSGSMAVSSNKRIREAQEVFIMVGTDKNPLTGENIQLVQDLDDARRLDAIINDDKARAIKRERFATLSAVGEIKHQNFGDVKRDLNMQITNFQRDKMKGR